MYIVTIAAALTCQSLHHSITKESTRSTTITLHLPQLIHSPINIKQCALLTYVQL